MINLRYLIAGIASISALVSPSFALAGASSGGGGGYVATHSGAIENGDNRVDFLEMTELSKAVKLQLERTITLLGSYGFGYTDFVGRYVLNPRISYYVVDQLPCSDTDMSMVIAVDEKGGTGGCTKGNETWLLRKVIRNRKLNPYAFVAMLVHERLHALPVDVPHRFIVEVAAGLRRALEIYNEQLNGERPKLSQKDLRFLQRMVVAIQEINNIARIGETNRTLPYERYFGERQIFPNGGGLILGMLGKSIASDAYISVGSAVRAESTIESGAEIVDSMLDNVKLTAGRRAVIGDIKQLHDETTIELADGAKLEKTWISLNALTNGVLIRLGTNTVVSNNTFDFTNYPPAFRSDASYPATLKLVFGNNVLFTGFNGSNITLGDFDEDSVAAGDGLTSAENDLPRFSQWKTTKTLSFLDGARLNMTGVRYRCEIRHKRVESHINGDDILRRLRSSKELSLLGGRVEIQSSEDFAKLCVLGELKRI